ncbi:MAG: phosphate acyltransferase [Candidatus Bruticola sp.]
MEQIRSLDQLVESLRGKARRRVAVAAGHDHNVIRAAADAVNRGIAEIILVGRVAQIKEMCAEYSISPDLFTLLDEESPIGAGIVARDMVVQGRADILMKGLLNTDQYMRLILDKDKGLLPKGAVLTHIACLEIPEYVKQQQKLLLVSDVAIIPAPDLAAKMKMISYAVEAAHSFGISVPKVAVLAPTEKVLPKISSCLEAAALSKMGERGQFGSCIVEGPLAFDVAISPECCAVKGLRTSTEGAADILIFHCLEAANTFYKVCTIFAKARVAGVVAGASAPCVLTSRADSEETKLYSIALACRMAK